jgi:hypothetical protein
VLTESDDVIFEGGTVEDDTEEPFDPSFWSM